MALKAGLRILRNRYRLIDTKLSATEVSESWVGVDEDDSKYLVRIWPFVGDNPEDLQRALWDVELRTLYRVSSAPGAEETILTIRDAGVDRDARCFVMVLEAHDSHGYLPLATGLANRQSHPWLSNQEVETRRDLWFGLQRLADGLSLLHEQNVLHRNVDADQIFFNPELGSPSLRLGGFEWSIRLGAPATQAPPPNWSSPLEFFTTSAYAYHPETDWYGFGMLAARSLCSVENFGTNPPADRYQRVAQAINRAPPKRLSDLEREFLQRLIAADPNERLSHSSEIRTLIRDIISNLEHPRKLQTKQAPLVVAVHPKTSQKLIDRMVELGFKPDPENPGELFNPANIVHVSRFTNFIQSDLANAQIYAVPKRNFYLLVGDRLILMIGQFEYTDRQTNSRERTWNFAYCLGLGELRGNEGGSAWNQIPENAIVVRTVRDVMNNRSIRQNARDWVTQLPVIDPAIQLRVALAEFHNFIRCTNQIELLMRDAELFPYEVVTTDFGQDGLCKAVIRETERMRHAPTFCAVEGGLIEFLQREIESNKPDCRLVVLTGPEQNKLILEEFAKKGDAWTVDNIDTQQKRVEIRRVQADSSNVGPPSPGFIRTWGMFGQTHLVRRRKRAIDRLNRHSFLLRSLSAPGQVYMDTGSVPLPVALSADEVDKAKQAAIEDILRVRPIYALQGPPGTGKTTLVAHLLRQIFDDDPVAQVLITAQAHGAVDVLRAKVRDDVFSGVAVDRQPLAVRLGTTKPEGEVVDGSVEQVSLDILRLANELLSRTGSPSSLQEEWRQTTTDMIDALSSGASNSDAADFSQIVKRGANITYCTTSAGDLEALADSIQSFDWTIIEEAGKCHGFDLALPLQTGHRWLLIGDHKQLPPYRFKDYRDGIDAMETVVEALEALPGIRANILDIDWVRDWNDRSSEERDSFKAFARQWLNTYERIFELCSKAPGVEKKTIEQAEGAAAGILSHQHRMHPTIGDLISTAYYDDTLVNQTVQSDGQPISRVVHPFTQPSGVAGRAIIWLDTGWAAKNPQSEERGPRNGMPRYTNLIEVDALAALLCQLGTGEGDLGSRTDPLDLVVLSPYNQQVALINRRLSDTLTLPAEATLMSDHRRLTAPEESRLANRRLAHTVDSFQGNQADVVCISLVRNNTLPSGEGLGFLEEAPRINVLLSRAERLLILVGGWEFFEFQVRAIDLADRQHPLWHWKKVITTLSEWFDSGLASKISVPPMLEGLSQ